MNQGAPTAPYRALHPSHAHKNNLSENIRPFHGYRQYNKLSLESIKYSLELDNFALSIIPIVQ